MITVSLVGGLGNQLFQIATAHSFALDNKDCCAFNFNVPCVYQGNSPMVYRNSVFKNFTDLPVGWRGRTIYKERGYGYNVIPYRTGGMTLVGYFGNIKYFNHRRGEIISLFKEDSVIDYLKRKYEKVLKNSVSVHVRRGDYFNFPKMYYVQDIDYYNNALEHIDRNTRIDNILIMSDDIKWCKENFKDKRITFIEGYMDYIDMYLMSLCGCNVISNSSFSWWGSYLNKNDNKIVCSPKNWFKPNNAAKEEYVVCNNWVII